jgi:hypothetical protein
MQPDCSLPPVVIYKDDHQPCGGEKRAGLRPPPALSFKDVHHPRWGGRRAELGSCLPHGLATRFFLQHLEEKGVYQPPLLPSVVSCRVSGSLAWMALVPTPTLPSTADRGVAVCLPHGRQSRRAQVCHIHGVSRATGRTVPTPSGGSYKTSYAVGVAATFLDGLVLTP